jgi:Tfp pilus assembly protein PilO
MTKPKFSRGMAIGMIVGGDVVLLALGWLLLVAPQRSTAASIARSTQAAQAQIVQLQQSAQEAAHPVVPKQPVIQTAGLYGLDKAMPGSTDMPDVMLELDQIARASGVTLVSITPGSAQAGTTFTVIPIAMSFSGDFYTLTDLLYRLRTLVTLRHGQLDTAGRLFSVASIGLAPNGTGNDLNATVNIDTFVYGVAGAVAATAVPDVNTDTTSTDTTTTATTAADAAP